MEGSLLGQPGVDVLHAVEVDGSGEQDAVTTHRLAMVEHLAEAPL